jgi:predicted dehydrogenase
VRATPFFWRVHLFGTSGSAEVLDEGTMILRRSGEKPRRLTYPAIDVLRTELDAFADAVDNKCAFPVPEADVLATLAAFEAALASMKSGLPVVCQNA